MSESRRGATSEKWMRSRRNILAIAGLLAGELLSSCKPDEDLLRLQEDLKRFEGDPKPHCYVKGTQILTPCGERKIEDLRIGDVVTTVTGGEVPVRWIARRRCRRLPNTDWDESVMPVRIARGALGTNVPSRDLFVSHDHRIYLDGILIRAADILNGSSIAIDDRTKQPELEYLHIMVDRHEVIIAEGAPCETLLFNEATMRSFDNYEEYERLCGLQTDASERPYAPVYASLGGRAQLHSHFRRAVSPWIDHRDQFDKALDRLAFHTIQLQRYGFEKT